MELELIFDDGATNIALLAELCWFIGAMKHSDGWPLPMNPRSTRVYGLLSPPLSSRAGEGGLLCAAVATNIALLAELCWLIGAMNHSDGWPLLTELFHFGEPASLCFEDLDGAETGVSFVCCRCNLHVALMICFCNSDSCACRLPAPPDCPPACWPSPPPPAPWRKTSSNARTSAKYMSPAIRRTFPSGPMSSAHRNHVNSWSGF